MTMPAPDDTSVLLERWYSGDEPALERLMAQNVEWMQRRIRRDLNPKLRRRFDSMDLVQDAAMRIIRYGPKFAPENRAQFRALLSKVLVAALRDRVDALQAEKRNMAREESAPSVSKLERAFQAGSTANPAARVERREMQDWVRLGLEVMEPVERQLIVLRQYENRPFDEIAGTLGLSNADAARMRFNRALPKLAVKIRELQRAAREAVETIVLEADLDG